MLPISGTFLDEITHDIPSQNWGPADWAGDFDAMRAIGIDTVILIRAGYRNRVTFDSKVLQERVDALPAYVDLVELFLRESERTGMTFFFGLYDSGQYWHSGRYDLEADVNRAFCDEVIAKYGDYSAFGGWYISHEISTYDEGMMRIYDVLASHLRALKPVPILLSPYIKGVKQFGGEALALGRHAREWEAVFDRLEGHVDIVAFQDGNVPYAELPDYLQLHRELAASRGIRCWSNVETFDRDMPIKFPPIDYRLLRYKMEQADKARVEKLITFEFSHFMSPNSIYPAARGLYRRYRESLGV